MRLSLAYSPCPNDTYIFHAIATGRVGSAGSSRGAPGLVPVGFEFDIALEDIDTLNRLVAERSVDVAKISYAAYGHVADDYVFLRSGGALGSGVGPLVVSRDPLLDLAGATVAIPGGRTTATLLLLLLRDDVDLVVMRYDEIMPAVAAGTVDAGLIIHESRFTYHEHGLSCLLDLGAWWEREVGHLVPLGAIVARRSLGPAVHAALDALVLASVRAANADPHGTDAYVAAHSQEMAPDVRQRHIDLYVNEYSLDVGAAGEAAVRDLLARAAARGLHQPVAEPLFVSASATGAVGSGTVAASSLAASARRG